MALTANTIPPEWSSAYSPILLKLVSDLWPNPPTPEVITAVSDSGGFAKFTFVSLPAGTVVNSYLYISSLEYNGLAKVVSLPGGNTAVTDMIYTTSVITGGTGGKGYANYRAIVNIFAPDADGHWYKLIQLKQAASPDGLYTFDLSPYLQTLVTKPSLDADPVQDAVRTYKKYAITYAEAYDEVGLDGEIVYSVKEDEPILIDACVDVDMFTNSDFSGGSTGWITGGSDANWDFTGGNAETQMPNLYSDFLGQEVELNEGEMYQIDIDIALPTECCTQNVYIQILVEDADGNIHVVSEVLAQNGTMKFAFAAPFDGTCTVSMRFVVRDSVSECDECNFFVDNFQLSYINDCLLPLYAHNSVDLYLEVLDSAYPLQPWTAGNAARKFLTNRPRVTHALYDDDREFLSAIIPSGLGVVDIVIRARLYGTGVLTDTDDEIISYTPQRIQIQTDYNAVLDRFTSFSGSPDQWSIQLYAKAGVVYTAITEEYVYTRKTECRGSYTRRLFFLTSKGDYASFYFTGGATHSVSANRLGQYETYPNRFGASKDYRQYGSTLNETRRELALESEFAPREVIDWMADEIFRSVDVLYEVEPGFYIPVEIDGNSLEKYADIQKLFNIQLKIRYAFSDESQRR